MNLEEIQQLVGLGLLELCKAGHEPAIHVESLQTRHRVSAHSWMVSIDWRSVRTCSPKIEDCVVCSSKLSRI
jgi:hypothetical protein